MVLEHLLDLVEEDAGLGLCGLLGVVLLLLLGTKEDFALRKKGSQGTGESGNAGAGPEEGAPTGVGDEIKVYDGSDEVADGITLLHDTTGKTATLDGEVLEGGGGG